MQSFQKDFDKHDVRITEIDKNLNKLVMGFNEFIIRFDTLSKEVNEISTLVKTVDHHELKINNFSERVANLEAEIKKLQTDNQRFASTFDLIKWMWLIIFAISGIIAWGVDLVFRLWPH